MNQYEIEQLNKKITRLELENEAIVDRMESMKGELKNLINSEMEELKNWVMENTLNANDIRCFSEVGNDYADAIRELQKELKVRFPDFQCWEMIA